MVIIVMDESRGALTTQTGHLTPSFVECPEGLGPFFRPFTLDDEIYDNVYWCDEGDVTYDPNRNIKKFLCFCL